jgi:hypothetical protein
LIEKSFPSREDEAIKSLNLPEPSNGSGNSRNFDLVEEIKEPD